MDNRYYPLIQKQYDEVTYVDTILSLDEITTLFSTLDMRNLEAGLIGSPDLSSQDSIDKEKERSYTLRKSNTIFLEDYIQYDWLYKKLASIILQVNCLNYNHLLYGIQSLQYTEYDSSYHGFYGKHEDCINTNHGIQRVLSFSIQLTDPDTYTGGDLVIYTKQPAYAKKQLGSMTIFPSNISHEVLPVKTGFRKSLVGWVVGPRV